MNKPNRKRNRTITVRMNDAEYNEFLTKVNEAGVSQQTFIIGAVHDSTITSSDQLQVLMQISCTFADLERQLRGLATNVNQMARVANGLGMIPIESELSRISDQLTSYRKESEKVWQSIRSSISQPKATEQ